MDCCKTKDKSKKCIRKRDGKEFTFPRLYSKKQCTRQKIKGFTMKSSCTPWLECSKNKNQKGGKAKRKSKKLQFLYNPNNPKKSFDVYINKNPNDTIPIKYTTINDIQKTIIKLEKLFKTGKYPHKRIWQVGMIIKVRLEAMKKHRSKLYPNAKNVHKRYALALRYFKFLKLRTSLEKRERLKLKFKL